MSTKRLSPSSIRCVDVRPLDIPLLEPFGISSGEQVIAKNVLVTVELADGTRGYGEAAPFPAYNGETQATALNVLRRSQLWLRGKNARMWRSIARDFRQRGGAACGSAQCALESALLDALKRQEKCPLWKFFGGTGTTLETDMTVTTGTAEAAASAAKAITRRGIRVIKVKVGGHAVKHDLARLAAIREAAPNSPLILDGNAALSLSTAREMVRGLRTLGIVPALLEQWLAKEDLAGMAALVKETGWEVAADESVCTAADARRIARKRAATVINIKLMKCGILEALEIAKVAKQTGLGLMIGGNVESILSMTLSACFAAGLGGFSFADLDTPLFLAENPFKGGYKLNGGQISVAHIKAGHGVTPAN